jgi:hypothetical protein
MKSSLHSPIPFLPFLLSHLRLLFLLSHLRLLPPELDPILDKSNNLLCPFIILRHGPRRKHSLSIVEKAYLLICCLTMDVLLLRVYASAGTCLPSRCLAMGLYVTVLKRGLDQWSTLLDLLWWNVASNSTFFQLRRDSLRTDQTA